MDKKKVNLFGSEYYVYKNGDIKNAKSKRKLKPYLSSGNYLYIIVATNKGKRKHHIRVHRLVAKAFIPNPNNYKCVNHIDGNKLNNNVDNLEWCDYSQNIKHAYNNGLMKSGGKTKTKVNQYDLNGKFIKTWNSMSEIEKEFNVSHSAIRFCCLNKIKTCKGYIWRYADK